MLVARNVPTESCPVSTLTSSTAVASWPAVTPNDLPLLPGRDGALSSRTVSLFLSAKNVIENSVNAPCSSEVPPGRVTLRLVPVPLKRA